MLRVYKITTWVMWFLVSSMVGITCTQPTWLPSWIMLTFALVSFALTMVSMLLGVLAYREQRDSTHE